MKRVCWPEQDHLRRMRSGREMHWSRIDCHQEFRPRNQRCQGQQIRFCGEVDCLFPRKLCNRCDVRLLVGGWAAGQDKIEVLVFEAVNDFGPALGFPELFAASRAGMQNQVGSRDFRIATKRIGIFVCGLWQV